MYGSVLFIFTFYQNIFWLSVSFWCTQKNHWSEIILSAKVNNLRIPFTASVSPGLIFFRRFGSVLVLMWAYVARAYHKGCLTRPGMRTQITLGHIIHALLFYKLKERHNPENTGIGEKMKWKWILMEQSWSERTSFNCPCTGADGSLLWTWQ